MAYKWKSCDLNPDLSDAKVLALITTLHSHPTQICPWNFDINMANQISVSPSHISPFSHVLDPNYRPIIQWRTLESRDRASFLDMWLMQLHVCHSRMALCLGVSLLIFLIIFQQFYFSLGSTNYVSSLACRVIFDTLFHMFFSPLPLFLISQ